MREWLSYELSDFLLFSERVYWRLFVLENAELWPLPVIAPLVMSGALAVYGYNVKIGQHAIAATLAVLWASIGWHFVFLRYAPINWAMVYAAPVIAFQAATCAALVFRRPSGAEPGPLRCYAGYGLVVFGVFVYPLLSLIYGRPLAGAEIFGIAPDPTAAVSAGAAFLMRKGWSPRALMTFSLLWLSQSAVTLWLLTDTAAVVPVLVVLTSLAVVGLDRAALRKES